MTLGLQYTKAVLRNWKDHHPSLYRTYQRENRLEHEAQKVSKSASAQVAKLMEQGMQKHEAEEMVLPETVNLPPSEA